MIKIPEKNKSIFDKTLEDIYKEEKEKQKVKSMISQGVTKRKKEKILAKLR